jgi:nitronate monooxygenase
MDLLGASVRWPLVAAPMAGGPSTPALAAAIGDSGGLGFLAAGYLTADAMRAEIDEFHRLSPAAFGVNVFVPQLGAVDAPALDAYLESLRAEASALGVDVVASWDDGEWSAKIAALIADPVPIVSFTFGCPEREIIRQLQEAGSRVVITITSPDEALVAADFGCDAVCAQGFEAGGHQSTFVDGTDPGRTWGVCELVRATREAVSIPIIAAGGLMTGYSVAEVLRCGAIAGQLGTAFLLTPESGAPEVHKRALVDPGFSGTAITRAFTGRRARGLVNDFMRNHPDAPSAYPQINNATRALRRAAIDRGDPHGTNLWAGTAHDQARAAPAGEILRRIGAEFDRAARP